MVWFDDKAAFDPGNAGEVVVYRAQVLGLGDDGDGAAIARQIVACNRAVGAILGSFEGPGFFSDISRFALGIESVDFDVFEERISTMIDDDKHGRLIGPAKQGEGVGRLGTITMRMKVTIGEVDDGTFFRIKELGAVRDDDIEFVCVTEEVEKIHDRDLGWVRCMDGDMRGESEQERKVGRSLHGMQRGVAASQGQEL